jgi:uncharacterized protein YndB with AHSA1/START domain
VCGILEAIQSRDYDLALVQRRLLNRLHAAEAAEGEAADTPIRETVQTAGGRGAGRHDHQDLFGRAQGGTRIVHAVTIQAPVEQVWPWLGQGRGGFYSYEWPQNLVAGCDMENADRIHPEWQHRELGETIHLQPGGGLRVSVFEPGRELGLEAWGTFALEPLGRDRTRPIARGGVPVASRQARNPRGSPHMWSGCPS